MPMVKALPMRSHARMLPSPPHMAHAACAMHDMGTIPLGNGGGRCIRQETGFDGSGLEKPDGEHEGRHWQRDA
ncbi:MAG: hypothetical protein JWL62_683 [Hyphomicrobiales bacterium]|nr:hypothetical protein [Hyphomicrobiales bacterium]